MTNKTDVSWKQYLWDLADESAHYLCRIEVGILIAVLVLYWAYRRCRGTTTTTTATTTNTTTTGGTTHTKALYLARESARKLNNSLEQRERDPLTSYMSAVEANILAKTAKDMVDDPDRLSSELGVDMFQYLAYCANVLGDAQSFIARMLS